MNNRIVWKQTSVEGIQSQSYFDQIYAQIPADCWDANCPLLLVQVNRETGKAVDIWPMTGRAAMFAYLADDRNTLGPVIVFRKIGGIAYLYAHVKN